MLSNDQETITALLAQQTPVNFRAGGMSMTPTIRDGDLVRVRPLPPRQAQAGHIILYMAHQRLILHRMLDCRGEQARTTGDAALCGQELIHRDDILGVAEWVQRTGAKRRLDRRRDRLAGLIRYHLRPARRAVMAIWHAVHRKS